MAVVCLDTRGDDGYNHLDQAARTQVPCSHFGNFRSESGSKSKPPTIYFNVMSARLRALTLILNYYLHSFKGRCQLTLQVLRLFLSNSQKYQKS